MCYPTQILQSHFQMRTFIKKSEDVPTLRQPILRLFLAIVNADCNYLSHCFIRLIASSQSL